MLVSRRGRPAHPAAAAAAAAASKNMYFHIYTKKICMYTGIWKKDLYTEICTQICTQIYTQRSEIK